MNAEQVIKHFGGEMQAAIALGKSHQTIKNWLKNKRIPLFSQHWIQLETGGKLKMDKEVQK